MALFERIIIAKRQKKEKKRNAQSSGHGIIWLVREALSKKIVALP